MSRGSPLAVRKMNGMASVAESDRRLRGSQGDGRDIQDPLRRGDPANLGDDRDMSSRRDRLPNTGAGGTGLGLAIAANMTREQAVHFIEKYKDLRRPLFDYMDKTREFARKEGY